VPGEVLNALFLSLMPFRLTQHKYVRLLAATAISARWRLRAHGEMDFRQPAAGRGCAGAVRQVVLSGEPPGPRDAAIGGRSVDLGEIRQPVLNLYALGITRPAGCLGGHARYLGSADYTGCGIDTGTSACM